MRIHEVTEAYDARHIENLKEFMRRTKLIFNVGIGRISTLYGSYPLPQGVPFKLSEYPTLKAGIEKELRQMAAKINGNIVNGIENEWTLSNNKNDSILKLVLGGKTIPTELQSKYFARNLDGLRAFKNRVEGGMNLSDRVWNVTKQFAKDIEANIAIGVKQGMAATDLATSLQYYLNNPTEMWEKLQGVDVNLYGKLIENYPTGQGVYKSPYKNALRLARTEINMSYRSADNDRWANQDFVLGIEIQRSQAEYDCDICEELQGVYPKTFQFVGWHPQCRCVALPILPSDNDLLRGIEDDDYKYQGYVKDYPEQYLNHRDHEH